MILMIGFIIFITSSIVASILTIAAVILASRANQSQPIIEEHEAFVDYQSNQGFCSRVYPVEINP